MTKPTAATGLSLSVFRRDDDTLVPISDPKPVIRLAFAGQYGEGHPLDLETMKTLQRQMRNGSSVVVFSDFLQLSDVKRTLDEAGFKQTRYLHVFSRDDSSYFLDTGAMREIVVIAVRGGASTFNDAYNNGHIGEAAGTGRIEIMLETLVSIHSNPGDTIVSLDSSLDGLLSGLRYPVRERPQPDPEMVEKYRKKRAAAVAPDAATSDAAATEGNEAGVPSLDPASETGILGLDTAEASAARIAAE